ncbi:MAG: hypothetical protein KME32_34500 [Mojavia pulchra JT2-VF2]|uniref:Uncharacterized protein n=1 Tax=Mojavia pulchra JT2-VF2 TaxID=287848 RepID=A0A951Q661_9NOST|nr:hypothetical protein [Mojavia pulchra JT2-VF2]
MAAVRSPLSFAKILLFVATPSLDFQMLIRVYNQRLLRRRSNSATLTSGFYLNYAIITI